MPVYILYKLLIISQNYSLFRRKHMTKLLFARKTYKVAMCQHIGCRRYKKNCSQFCIHALRLAMNPKPFIKNIKNFRDKYM